MDDNTGNDASKSAAPPVATFAHSKSPQAEAERARVAEISEEMTRARAREVLHDELTPMEPLPTIDLGGGLVATASFAQLSAALARAQAQFGALTAGRTAKVRGEKNGRTYDFTYTYADLADALAACTPALSSEGLALIQAPMVEEAREVTVTTILVHTSGEYLKTSLTLTAEAATPQKIGAASTYARRYSLLALVGLSPEDDDAQPGQGQGGNGRRRSSAPPPAKMTDELEAEIASIHNAMMKAETEEAVKAVMPRINKLPNEEKQKMHQPYMDRLAEVSS